ncbi:MAG: Asd/ArgC dimerization domain-containing protein, partial [Spirochaetota bacterium]|nr:Asd/ArgC dimerization domain-containing protein [Spirochaetota bacterium]
DSLFVECNENFIAYKVTLHQHTPEIEKAIHSFTGQSSPIIFTPHLVPMDRGILSTIYISLDENSPSETEIRNHYQSFYETSQYVKVLESGILPQTKNVTYTNECHISLAVDERTHTLKIFSVIDNLVKGAAGSALQNFNIMFSLDESTALE